MDEATAAVAAAGGEVAKKAAEGGWAFAVFAVVMVALVVVTVFWLWVRHKPVPPPPPAADCPPGGCPQIHAVSVKIDALEKRLEDDRQERAEHRAQLRDDIRRIHDRIDDCVSNDDLTAITNIFRQFQEEASATFRTLRDQAEDRQLETLGGHRRRG